MNEPENKKLLTPRKELEIFGKISYKESLGLWSIIRLKKEIINEFPQLKEKRSRFGYKMNYYRDIAQLENVVKELKKNKDQPMPVLMWLYKEE